VQIDFIDLGPTPLSKLEVDVHFSGFGAILIEGGWGYSPEDAVVVGIDPVAMDCPPGDPVPTANQCVDYVGFEYAFADFRLGKELFVPGRDAVYRDVEREVAMQGLVDLNGRKFDHLALDVHAVAVADYTALIDHLTKEDEAGDAAFEEKYNGLKRSGQCDYWFDISAFF